MERLKDIDVQDRFYHYFVYLYSWLYGFTPNDNTITQLKNAGGFNVIQKKMIKFTTNHMSKRRNLNNTFRTS
ncbi:MAG TPA: hypothetical protein VGI82_13655 [Chitinophagaceae bacterium]